MSKPWMPLYIADYRKDTAHLGAAEHGAYLLLIMHYWAAGALPDDDRQLARIAAMSPAEWRRARPVVQAFFSDGWKHKRIDVELAHAEQVSCKRRAAAEQKHSKPHAIAPANAEQLQTHAGATSQPQSPSEETQTVSSEARKRATRLSADWWPTHDNVVYAKAKGLLPGEINLEAEKFRNHWIAKAGRDAAKLDWDATWQNWILRAVEQRGKPNGHAGNRKPSLVERGHKLAAEARRLEAAAGLGRSPDAVGSD